MTHVSDPNFEVPHIPGPPLCKLIRSKATKAFLTQHGAWTADIASATPFADISAAVAAKHEFHLEGELELYYSFDFPRQSRWDFTMNLYTVTLPSVSSASSSSPRQRKE